MYCINSIYFAKKIGTQNRRRMKCYGYRIAEVSRRRGGEGRGGEGALRQLIWGHES